MVQILLAFGIPTAITGFITWWLKRKIDASDKKHQEQEKDLESLILMMMESTRANTIGIQAIATAVQRIPDAHCLIVFSYVVHSHKNYVSKPDAAVLPA